MSARLLLCILVAAGCAGAANSSNAKLSDQYHYPRAHIAEDRANGIFFVSAPVTPRPDGSMPVFTMADTRTHTAPHLSPDMRHALVRVTSEIRPEYRKGLRFTFPFSPSGGQFFAMFLQQDTQFHIVNLCLSYPPWHCKHRCSGSVDFVTHGKFGVQFRDAACMDKTPYWKQLTETELFG
jgi:hypothetical protein